MNVYPNFLLEVTAGGIDMATAAWAVKATTGTFDPLDTTMADITTVGDLTVIPGPAVAIDGGGLGYNITTTAISEATALTLANVGTAAVDALALFVNTGVAATSTLVYWVDRRAGGVPVTFTGDGGNVLLWFPAGWFLALR